MTLSCYKPTTLAEKEIQNHKMQKTALVRAENSSGGSKAYEAPGQVPDSPNEREGADGLTLKRAIKENKYRNGRKKLGPKKENVLDPLVSLFAINKLKKTVISVCCSVSH